MGLFDEIIGINNGVRRITAYGKHKFKGSVEVIGEIHDVIDVTREKLVDTGISYANLSQLGSVNIINELNEVHVDVTEHDEDVFLMSVTGFVDNHAVLIDSVLLEELVEVRESEIVIVTKSIRVVLDTRGLSVDDVHSQELTIETKEDDGTLEKALGEIGDGVYECSFSDSDGNEIVVVINGFLSHRKVDDTLYLDADGRYKNDMNTIHVSGKVNFEDGVRVSLTNKHIESILFELGDTGVAIERVR